MRIELCLTFLCLWCLALSSSAAQVVDPNKPGGSQVAPRPIRPGSKPPPRSGGGGVAGAPRSPRVGGSAVRVDSKGGATSITTASGTKAHLNPATGKVTMVRHVSPDGTSTVIFRSPSGLTTTEYESRDLYGHTVRVVRSGNIHYRERDLLRRPGYRQRSYYDNGHISVRLYRDHIYGRFGTYSVYVPPYYYGAAYYDYLRSAWSAPVTFSWAGNPGYGYYGAYFAPLSSYVSPAAWLVDSIIAENLKEDFASQQEIQEGDAEAQTLPLQSIPNDIRATYIRQVQAAVGQIEAEADGRPVAEEFPAALNPEFTVFQSYSDVQAQHNADECALTGGDFVRREAGLPDSSGTVAVTVVAVVRSTVSHCELNATVRLSVKTLQDWHNNFMFGLQNGVEELAVYQGKKGFPPAPDVTKVSNPSGLGIPDDRQTLENSFQEAQTTAAHIEAEVESVPKQ